MEKQNALLPSSFVKLSIIFNDLTVSVITKIINIKAIFNIKISSD